MYEMLDQVDCGVLKTLVGCFQAQYGEQTEGAEGQQKQETSGQQQVQASA